MQNIISKSTKTTSRSIFAVSFAWVTSSLIGFSIEKVPLVHQSDLDSDTLAKLSIPFLIFLLFSHLVSWIVDHSNYKKEYNESMLLSIRQDLTKIDHYIKLLESEETMDANRGLSNVIGNFKPELKKLRHPIERLGYSGRIAEFIYVYFLHLLLPLILSIWTFIIIS